MKAYEYAKNKFVVLDQEDLENLRKENEDKAVEIIDFVQLTEIDQSILNAPIFYHPIRRSQSLFIVTKNIRTIRENWHCQNRYPL